jgi:hypothetical protein
MDGSPQFDVGRRVTFQGKTDRTVGLANDAGAMARYKSEDYVKDHGFWAHFIYPTAIVESNGAFATVNSYDRAFFTFGFLQFGAHVPNGDFIKFLRLLLVDSEASDYFPDLTVQAGRVSRFEPSGVAPLETDQSTHDLMTYFNPTIHEIEDIEVVNSAKMIFWTNLRVSVQALQVKIGVDQFRSSMIAYAHRYGLDGRSDKVCLVVTDIRHQGRGSSSEILQALATNGDDDLAYRKLLKVGASVYGNRISQLDREVGKLVGAGVLGNKRYRLETGAFEPVG